MRPLIIITLCALLLACAGKPTPTVHAYLLESPGYPDQPAFDGEAPVLGLAQLDLADLLSQTGVVMQTGPHKITQATQHRWAEPLQAQLERQLYRSLTHNLSSAVVLLEPRRTDMAQYELRAKVYSFQGRFDGYAVIEGEWVLIEKSSGRVLDKASFTREIKLRSDGYDELVSRLSKGWHSILVDMVNRLQEAELNGV